MSTQLNYMIALPIEKLLRGMIRAMEPMIVVENHIPVKPEYREQFEKLFAGGTRFVQNAPGFVRNEVLRPIKGDDYIVQTYWESQEMFQNWVKSDDFKKAHSAPTPDEMFTGESRLEIHEVVAFTNRE